MIFIQKKEEKNSRLTLRLRFLLYVTSAIVASVALTLFLLSFFGVIDFSSSRIESYLEDQLDNHIAQTEHDIDKLVAYTLSFSQQLGIEINNYFDRKNITFADLENNIEALTELQKQCYGAVYTNIRIAPCSGAFYVLDTTVNSNSDIKLNNGVYIKFANLFSDSTVNTKVSLFRGSSDIARHNGINLFTTWQNEMKTCAFDDPDFFKDKEYALSRVTKIPETWERARYVYSPIYGNDSSVIGICGFELSDLYLQLAYNATDKECKQTVCALLDKTNGGYVGQFISNRSGYIPPSCKKITTNKDGDMTEYRCGAYKYIGKETDLFVGGSLLTVAMMIPKNQYDHIIRKGQLKYLSVFSIISIIAICACILLSKSYTAPIKSSIAQFKKHKAVTSPSGIAEIDDLFTFLAEQDRKNEEELARIESQNNQMQDTLKQISEENIEAQLEIARLAYSRKNEVDPDNYKQFVKGVKTLTNMEKTIFEYYLEGKKVKEIIDILGVKESTVRFHNRNIYSKLGVNSLKQLLLYASIMKQDKSGEANSQQ